MDITNILSTIDHTLLSPACTWEEVQVLCDDAIDYNAASICIPPCFVKQACEYVNGKIPVCTVIGFPNGYATTDTKIFETQNAIENGADEIDMVINIGALKSGNTAYVENEIRSIKAVCHDRVLKVIIETCLLTDDEKIAMCEIVTRAGADYIKTSTGFSSGGAAFDDIALISQHIGPNVKIKASGGISSLEQAEKYIALGCSRLGTSKIIKIIKAE